MNIRQMPRIGDDPSPQGRQFGPLVRMFLRHYAHNLRRSWRNTPHDAFVDAQVQVEVLLAVAVMAPLALLDLLLSRTIFPSLAHGIHGKTYGVLLVVILAMAIIWQVDGNLKKYEIIPGIETNYDTSRDRRLVYVYYAAGFIVFGAALLAAYYINRAFPAS
jgi:hypothetical protein